MRVINVRLGQHMAKRSFEEQSLDADRVCAIIVSYNPSEQLLENVAAIVGQVGEVLIVDNASAVEGGRVLVAAAKHERVSVMYNTNNLGIAAALNMGVRQALNQRYPWVITLDQDSTVPSGYVEQLLATWRTCPFCSEVALVSPRYRDRYTGNIASYAVGGGSGAFAEVMTTMTSGNLVRSDVFAVTGMFEESFFMDCVDHEFCLRLRRHGYRLIEAQDALLEHSLGQMEYHTVAGLRFKTFNHSPLRRYYNARNRVLVYRRYCWNFPGWVCTDLTNFCREIGGIIFFEEQAVTKLMAVFRGISHGLSGRTGKA